MRKIRKILRLIPDKPYLQIYFFYHLGRFVNFNHPVSFNEKLQWLKLNDRKDIYSSMVDKFEAKKLISDLVGEEYVIRTLGVWDDIESVNFDVLPEQFVIKCTHDSGGARIVKSKSDIDLEKLKLELQQGLSENYYYRYREWPYKNVKPRIIAEEYLGSDNVDIIDYKLMCFNGTVKCSFTCSSRYSEKGLRVTWYDRDWERMEFTRHYPKEEYDIPCPQNYNKMIEIAEKIAKDIPFLRVDFYEVNGKLYVGELTFYPGGGFEEFNPSKYDYVLGEWLHIKIGKSQRKRYN